MVSSCYTPYVIRTMEILGLGPRLRMIVVTNFLTLSALTARALNVQQGN